MVTIIPDERIDEEAVETVARLSRDLKNSARLLTREQARYLVDLYYELQDDRIRANNQKRAHTEDVEPNELISWFADRQMDLETDAKKALDIYSDAQIPGQWAKSIVGIGPVIAAGLLAHVDIEKAPTAGHIWRFAGLDPTVKWGKGEKRPWNAQLKVLTWKAGESFVKQQSRPNDVYGKIYVERKMLEIARNERGDFKDQAEASLAEKNFGKDTAARAAYEQGMLPPARIHLRAQRYAVKLFLAHFHHVLYEDRYGTPPPKPYVIEHGGHTHYIAPPHWVDGQLSVD